MEKKELIYTKEENIRLDSLQGLRFWAFTGIFLSHVGIIELGEWGVSVFLIMSGFLMVYNYYEKKTPVKFIYCIKFAINKVRKLYPLHIITMVAAIVIQYKKGIIFYSFVRSIIDTGIIGLHMTMMQAWIPRSGVYFSLNGVSWYLSVAFFCYLVFPYLIKKIRKFKSDKNVFYGSICIWVIQIVVAYLSTYVRISVEITKDFTKWFTYVCPLFRLGDFVIGCNIGYLFLYYKNKRDDILNLNQIFWTLLELLSLLAGLCVSTLNLFDKFRWISTSVIYVPFSALMIWVFSLKKGYLSELLSRRIFLYLGGLTTFAYLIHFQVINDWQYFINSNIWIDFIACYIITIVISEIWKRFSKLINYNTRNGDDV